MTDIASQQVSWFEVHEYVTVLIAQSGATRWPVVGTPAWCALADVDPRKFAAVLDAAQHAALIWDARQEALAQTGADVAEGVQWRKVGFDMHERSKFFAARPWLKRRAA